MAGFGLKSLMGFSSDDDWDWTKANFDGKFPTDPVPISSIKPQILFSSELLLEPIISKCSTEDEIISGCLGVIKQKGTRKGRIIIITHGFRSNWGARWMEDLRQSLIRVSKDNVVGILNWSKGAEIIDYPQAAANALAVGNWLGNLVQSLERRLVGDFQIWGIGHSLGAHLMGRAGNSAALKFTRITGLDPAGPGFAKVIPGFRSLCYGDAKEMVDVIHTDGAKFGTLMPMGTIDFYPNYGVSVPRSLLNVFTSQLYAHSLAYIYFIWSIKNQGKFETKGILIGEIMDKVVKESKPAEMGYFADKVGGTKGHYFLATNDEEPWAPLKEKSWYEF